MIRLKQYEDSVQLIPNMLIIYSMKKSLNSFFPTYSKIASALFFLSYRYSLSASIYASSDTSFEDVTLKFFALRDKEPLRNYLQAVLQYQKSTTVTIRS